MAITWDVYDDERSVKLAQLQGNPRKFDMRGNLILPDGRNGPPLMVEVKHYCAYNSGQNTEYLDFLAKCYSATAKAIEDQADHGTEFMWVTWHPFNINDWAKLDTPAWIDKALPDQSRRLEYVGDGHVDSAVVKIVASRTFIVVLGRRSHELTMPDWLISEAKRLMYARMLP